MDKDENESVGKENRPTLNLEDDDPKLDHTDFPLNPKKQLNLELGTLDPSPDVNLLKVYLRMRPFFNDEIETGEDQNCFFVESDKSLVAHAPKDSNTNKNGKSISQKFTFSKIFPDNVGQKQFFEEAVLSTVKEFIHGQNSLVFTYGVTNSGKTYTMQGIQKDVGILPRSLDAIFNNIKDCQWNGCMLKPHMFCDVIRLPPEQEEQERKMKTALLKLAELEESDTGMTTIDSTMSEDSLMHHSILDSTCGDTNCDATEIGEVLSSGEKALEDTAIDMDSLNNIKFSVWVSFAEIYNENVHDLFAPMVRRKTMKGRPILLLREDKNGTPYIRGLHEIHVTSAEEAYKLLTVGKKNLQVACTKLNRNSSRSHCIFTIKMLRIVDDESPSRVKMSMLSFCDLAGSERCTKTQSLGERIKEAGNINTSLLTLGRCIKILRHNQINKEHPQVVPFRESKLTRLLQSFFCGKGQASMIVNINSCASMFDETLHVLSYSAIAKQVIVVQEPERAKKKKHSSRQFSMLLEQRCRDTIGWATPGTCAKLFEEEKTLQETEEEDEVESEDEETETEREKNLMELVRMLKEQLLQEKQKQLLIEARVREEVCKEVSEQMNKIESYYSDRLKQERASVEEKAEKRLEIYMKSLHRSRKRQRLIDDAEVEEIEQTKIQQYEKEIEELKDQLAVLTKQNEQLKAAATTASKQRDQLQQENTSIKFHMSDLEIKLEKSETSKLDHSMANASACEPSDLASKLCETERELEKQRQMVTKLQQFIDMLQCDAADGECKVKNAKKENDQKTKQVASLEEQLIGKNTKIEELKNELLEKDSKLTEMSSVLLEQEKQLEDLQKTVDHITDELEKLQQENSSQDDMLITMHRELEELRKKEKKPCNTPSSNKYKDASTEVEKNTLSATELTEEKAHLLSQVAELRDAADKYREEAKKLREEMMKETQNLTLQHEAELEELNLELSSKSKLDEQLKDVKHELELLKKDKQKLEIELQAAIDLQKEYEAMDEAKEKELDSAFAMNDQLKDELKQSKQAVDTLNAELAKLQKDFESAVAERNELEALLAKKDTEIQDGQALCEELRMELNELRNGLEQAKHNIQKTENNWKHGMNKEIKSVHEKLADSEMNVEMLKDSLKEVEKALVFKSDELEKAQTLIKNKDSEIERLQEQLKMTKKLHKENQQQLEDYIVKVNEQVVINGDLSEQLQEIMEEKSNLEHQLAKLQEEKVNRDNELENLQTELKFQRGHLDRKCGEYESRLFESEQKVKKLQEKIKEMAKQEETKLKETVAEMEKRYSTLQASMEIMAAETTAECMEHEEMMNKTHLEMQEKSTRIAELESELQHLKMLTGGKDREGTEMETALEEEKQKVISLMQKLNDAEYKHQILCRQLRREKNNVEKLLKTAEDESDAKEKQVSQLQSELNEMKQKLEESENEHEKRLETYKSRALKLEAVIEDLELCLKSSKEHEAKSLQELENIRQKYKHLENDCNNKEDTICSLNDELERMREESMMMANLSNSESTAQMESLRKEVMENKKVIDHLEIEINQLKEEKDTYKQKAEIDLQTAESNIKELTVAKTELENELKSCMIKIEDLSGNLESVVQELNEVKNSLTESEEKTNDLQNKLIKKESECEQLKNDLEKSVAELSKMKVEYDIIKEQLEEANCEEHSKVVESYEQKISEFTTQLSMAKDTIAGLEQRLAQMESDSSSELKDLQSQLIGKCNELAECHDKIGKQDAQLEQLQKTNVELDTKLTEKQQTSTEEVKRLEEKLKITSNELVESRDRVNKHVKMCSEFEEKCIQLEEAVKELKEENKSLHESISVKTESESVREDVIKGLEKKYKDLENKYQAELLQAKTHIKELETELEKKEKHISELNEIIQDLREKLNEQTSQVEECMHLKSQIVVLENKLVSLESAVSDAVSMKSKFENLESELQKQLLLKERAERTIKSLQEEVDELETKVKQSSSLSKDKLKLQEEVKTLQDELSQKQTAAGKERRMLEETIEKLEQENKMLNSESDKLLKRVAELKQLEEEHMDELKELRKNVEDTEKQLNEAVSRVKSLGDELDTCKQKLEMKEGKLKSRTEALSGFMVMMDQEKEQCEAALADAKANERVIEQLKKTLELQEAAMQDQDTCLMNKEEEINRLGEELQEKAERCLELQKKEQDYLKEIKLLKDESKMMKNKIKEMEACLSEQNVNEELEILRRAKNRAEEKLAKAKAKQDEAEKQLRERVRYEADLKETNEELQKIEKLLKERDEEIKLIRKQYEELKKQQSETNHNNQHEKETDSYAFKILKTKFQAKEELVRQLEQEKLQWKERAEMITEQKEQELIKWRSERDKLVVQIEKVIKEKEQQIAALQDGRDTSKLAELQQKIEEQEQIIKELNSRTKKTGYRSRKQRHKNAESSSTDDDTEQMKKDLCHLQKQLDQERSCHKEEMNKIIKAKDCVIEDMRQQNYKLASQLSDEEAAKQFNVPSSLASPGTIEQSLMLRSRAKHGTRQKIADYEQVTGNQCVTSTLNSAEHSEPVPRIRAKRGRTQKTKSAETDQDEDVVAGKRGNKRERKSSRSVKHHNRSSHLDENNDPSLIIIPEDDVIDLDEPASKKSGVSVLLNSTNITDLGKSILSTPKRMDSSLPDPTSSRRKKRLRSTVDKPLAFSPEEEIEQSDAKAVHDIVRRRLRSRKK